MNEDGRECIKRIRAILKEYDAEIAAFGGGEMLVVQNDDWISYEGGKIHGYQEDRT